MYIIMYPQYVHNITSHDTPMNEKTKVVILAKMVLELKR